MPPQLASLPPIPGYGINQPPEIQGAITDLKDNPRGEQLIGEASQIRAVTLTNAQLLALKGADVLIAEAPGRGYAIIFEGVSVRHNFKTAAFTLNAGNLRIFLGPSANANPVSADLSAVLSAVATSDIIGSPGLATGVLAQALSENLGLFVGNNGTAQYTVGGGTLDVVVYYTVVQM